MSPSHDLSLPLLNLHLPIMALGRLFHYGFDLLAVSTVLAGVKKSTGYAYVSPHTCFHPRRSSSSSLIFSIHLVRKPSKSNPKASAQWSTRTSRSETASSPPSLEWPSEASGLEGNYKLRAGMRIDFARN